MRPALPMALLLLNPLLLKAEDLPRDFLPGIVLDEPLPTRFKTGQALSLSGSVEDSTISFVRFAFLGTDGLQLDFWGWVVEDRFEREVVFPHSVAGQFDLVVDAQEETEDFASLGRFDGLQIDRGTGPVMLPRRFFPLVHLDQPLPTDLTTGEALHVAGTLERLTAVVELQDGNSWTAGEFVIEGVDTPVPDLEVGVLAVALLAGGQGRVPLFNRGDAAVELESPQVEGPFEVEAWPSVVAPGEAGEIVLSYGGPGGDQGLLTLVSDDPFRPRVSVALSGLERREAAFDLAHLRADASGRIESVFDLGEQDLVLALYAAPVERFDPARAYDISLDGSAALARPAVAARPDRRDSVDYLARQLERTLSLRVRQSGRWAGKPTAVRYEVGDSRVFRFAAQDGVPSQSFKATVVAVNERVVAWVQDDLRADDDNIDEDRMQGVIDQFAEDYPIVVEAFGTPSDVDGDGRIAVVVTHLIQDVGAGGQFRASSLLPRRLGGDGNMTDLLWANPVIPEESYRSLLVHEFQHLINFNQHVLVRRGISEASWLNEGLSHLAEDLVVEPPNDNYRLVREFLAEPGSVGFSAGLVTYATRGAAYLFVRSLVDLLGEGVLLRLVQTGLRDRDNVEEATGEGFADLMARWAAQLYISGTGQSGHPRFNYGLGALRTPEGRGIPRPVSVTWRLGEEPPGLAIKPRGLQFLRVAGDGSGSLSLQTEPQARLGAVPLPAARAGASAAMAADHFTGLTLDSPPPLKLTTGEALLFEGTTADSVERIHLEFVPEEGGEPQTFFLLVDEGRFERTIFFHHDEAGTYSLNVYVLERRPTPFAGSFHSIRVARGGGPVRIPTRYFNRVRLDRPLPAAVHAGQPLHISGEVSDLEATRMEFSLFRQDEDGDRSGRAVTTLGLPVEAGRFDGRLRFDEVPLGIYWLSLEVGPAGDLTYVGAVTSFEIRPMITGVELAAEPPAFALHPNYPNPFNSRTVLSFSLPEDLPSVELAVYDLLGQKLAVLVRGPRASGLHSVEWDGRDDAGRNLASGSYLYRLEAGPYQGVGKLLLLR